jgi:hypothetical protein
VKTKIGSKTTFQLYLAKLEEEGTISKRKLSHKRVEFELLIDDEEIRKLERKLGSRGLTDQMRKLDTQLIGVLEGSLHTLPVNDSSLNECISASVPKWVENINLSDRNLYNSELENGDFPSFALLLGKEFEKKTISQLDEQFFLQGLNLLLGQLFLKFIEMRAKMQHPDPANREDWLRKSLDFEAVIAFNLTGRKILEKLDVKKASQG